MNEKTISYYNNNAREYSDSTFGLDMKEQHDKFIKNIPEGGLILDAGCGSGRDMLAFKKMGFEVIGIDASDELVKVAQQNTLSPVYTMSFDQINWKSHFDGVWCMASLLHLNKAELSTALHNIAVALKPEGQFYASLKTGEGESYDNKGRFFCYHKESDLKNLLEESKIFKDVSFSYNKDSLGRDDTQWININATVDKTILDLKPRNRSKFKI